MPLPLLFQTRRREEKVEEEEDLAESSLHEFYAHKECGGLHWWGHHYSRLKQEKAPKRTRQRIYDRSMPENKDRKETSVRTGLS